MTEELPRIEHAFSYCGLAKREEPALMLRLRMSLGVQVTETTHRQ